MKRYALVVVGAGRGWWLKRRLAPIAALTVLAGVLVAGQAGGQENPTTEFNGAFLDLGGIPPSAASTNVVLFRLSESGLGGEMHIRIDAPTEFSGSTTPGCVSFDVDLDASPLGISVDDQGSSKVDTDITILSGTETRECADVIGAEATPETAHMRADVTDTLITGALTIEGADFTFSARIGAAPGSTGLGTGALVFGKTLKGEDLFAVLGRSSCTVKTFQEKQKDAPECAPLFDANSSFKQDFATEFTDDDVRNELAGVASFSALRTPDGKAALLPSLRYLMPVLVVMAKKGDGGDADALLAMRRLIRLVIDQDLKA